MKKIRAIVLVRNEGEVPWGKADQVFIEGAGDGEFDCRINAVLESGEDGIQLLSSGDTKRVLVEVEYDDNHV